MMCQRQHQTLRTPPHKPLLNPQTSCLQAVKTMRTVVGFRDKYKVSRAASPCPEPRLVDDCESPMATSHVLGPEGGLDRFTRLPFPCGCGVAFLQNSGRERMESLVSRLRWPSFGTALTNSQSGSRGGLVSWGPYLNTYSVLRMCVTDIYIR